MTTVHAVKKIVVIGGGGHAKVVIDTARLAGLEPVAVLDSDPALQGESILSVPVLGDDHVLFDFPPHTFQLAMGIGGARLPETKIGLFNKLESQGYTFATIIHPSAIVATDATVGPGSQIMAGAVVQPATVIAKGALINTRASVDHDCYIGAFTHIGPGAVLCGNVSIGDGTLIGAGAVITPGLSVGSSVVIGAGAAVIRNVPAGVRFGGVPARDLGVPAR